MKASEVFARAAAVVRKRGLYKGWFHPPGRERRGPFCTMGAIRFAEIGTAGDWTPQTSRMCGDVADIVGEHGAPILWNDSPSRTKNDVIAALDAAYIVALQEEGLEPEDVLS